MKNKRRGPTTCTSNENHTERVPSKRHEREEDCEEGKEEEMIHKAKRRKSVITVVVEDGQGLNQEEMLKELEEELHKSNPSKQAIDRLMDNTAKARIFWIDRESPMVADILTKYPPLNTGKMLRRELRKRVEHDVEVPTVASISMWGLKLERLHCSQSKDERKLDRIADEDLKVVQFLKLLHKLLCPKAKTVFLFDAESDEDLEDQLWQQRQNEPFACFAGGQFFICVERKPYFQEKSGVLAIVNLLASFYCFNLVYPSSLMPIYYFLEQCIFNIPPSMPAQPIVTRVLSSLKDM
jgi:hypothetical protein